MSPARDSNDLPRVAGEAAWVRRLAVALAHDVHAGEDIAQDALLAASRGHRVADLRAWLAGAVRNLAQLRLRGDARRTTREREVARPERVDDPALAFERLELQEALLGAVRELAEPYRTTVLLRWFEELEPEEIAQRTGTPVRTVHTRLHRALGLLRESLDRRSRGDRSRWLAAWLPAFTKSSSGWKWLLLMELKTKLALAGLAVLAAVSAISILVLSSPTSTPAAPAGFATGTESPPANPTDPHDSRVLGGEEPAGNRQDLEAVRSSKEPAIASPFPRRVVRGLVLDATGAEMARLEVGFHAAERLSAALSARTKSDDQGRFEIEVDAERGSLEPISDDWIIVYRPQVTLPDPVEGYVLVVGRPKVIAGFVRGQSNEPIGGARVYFGPWDPGQGLGVAPMFGDPLAEAIGVNLSASRLEDHNWTTQSASDGSFAVQGVECTRGVWVGANAEGYDGAMVPPQAGTQPVVVVLHKRSDVAKGKLFGRVVDPIGKAVPRARLRLGSNEASSDERGEFVIDVDPHHPGARLIALHRNWRPVLQSCLSATPSDPGAWPNPLVLTMTQPQPGVAGVVVSLAGTPLSGVEVRALDPMTWNEMLGTLGEPSVERGDNTDEVLGDGVVTTDRHGRFQLGAIAGRNGRLLARDSHSLEIVVSDPIPPGTSTARIVLGNSGGRCLFAGHVVDLHGNAVAGVSIAATRTVSGSGPRSTIRLDAPGGSTDATGRFEMPNMTCDLEGFLVGVDPGGPARTVPIDSSMLRDALILRVGRNARVQVQIRTPGMHADTISFFDSNGKLCQVGKRLGEGWTGGDSWRLGDQLAGPGSTPELIVSEEAKTLVLTLRGEEVARVAIDLDPSRVTLVQP